ncbi:uncharacterized protein N7483_009857 [Penicillium malachiteum]|uniref:uncharacterized protein n=1 Tax=Penicillium malachiteum TaxID=1324776 RepID=UPI0025490E3F|nr:uncharacterized protein N7483_009857 [Penicillium malachiteum]KAJ5721923.1 hypothetical protein N7483_009857 [Penicillium malachiteum]
MVRYYRSAATRIPGDYDVEPSDSQNAKVPRLYFAQLGHERHKPDFEHNRALVSAYCVNSRSTMAAFQNYR